MNELMVRWQDDDATIGAWCTLGSAVAAETMSRSGFDYVVIDNQHGIADYASTVTLLMAIDCGDAVPIVRVPWNEPGIIAKMLDAGADGLIIPMVNSAEEARAAVAACRYPPEGLRSYGPVRAALRLNDYAANANDHVACIPMIETAAAVDRIDEILSVPGIDAIYVGPADLSISLGLPPGNPDHEPIFADALATVVDACHRHGVAPGIHSTTALAARRIEQGFRMVTAIADATAMREGLVAAANLATRHRATGAGGADSGAGADDGMY